MPRPDEFSDRKSSSMIKMGNRNFIALSYEGLTALNAHHDRATRRRQSKPAPCSLYRHGRKYLPQLRPQHQGRMQAYPS
jgi:hypothetical protein